MHKKKVAIFRTDLLPLSETFIRDQATALREWEPILLGRREVPGGLATPSIRRELVEAPRNHWIRALDYWLQRPDHRLVHRLQQLEVSLVHVHFGTDATDVWPNVKAAGLPMVVTLHGYDITIKKAWWERGHGGLRRILYPYKLRNIAKEPTVKFVAVSEAIKREAIKFGIPEQKITVSYIGTDTAKFKPKGLPVDKRENRILFVGRMVEKKSPILLIKAFSKILSKIPDAKLTMVGDGPLLSPAKQLALNLKLPIKFLGSCEAEEIIKQLCQAKLFCLPSITASNGDSEGLPISLLEAQACGVPCITTCHSGNPEAVKNNKTGIIVYKCDEIDLSDAFIYALTNHDFLRNAAELTRQNIMENFDIRKCTSFLEPIYDAASLENNLSDREKKEDLKEGDNRTWKEVERIDKSWNLRIRKRKRQMRY